MYVYVVVVVVVVVVVCIYTYMFVCTYVCVWGGIASCNLLVVIPGS